MLSLEQLKALRDNVKCVTIHWSASNYSQTFDDYHFCVTYDPASKKAALKQTLSLLTKGAHTWRRNTGNIGFSFMAMQDANHPVQQDQIEVISKTIAELFVLLNIKPDSVYDAPAYKNDGTNLIPLGITFRAPVIADHCYYAEKDGYGPHGSKDRWDIGDPSGIIKWQGKILNLLPEVYSKTLWYYSKLKSGEIKSEHTSSFF